MAAHGWRVVAETVKQKWGLSLEKNFRATSNSRNEAMFKEASTFAAHLRTVEKDLTTLERDIEAGFTNTRAIMLSPLPRVYEEGHSGAAVPSDPEPLMIGGDVQVERLTSAAAEARKRLDVEVLQPVKQWMVAYRTIAERMKRLEGLRLELDSRRRTVTDLQVKCERVRASLGATRGRGEVELEVSLRKMQHKEDKMQRAAAAYQEMEQTVYNSLFTLIKDTSVLRDYAAAAILIVQEAFQAAYAAFEPALPQYASSALPGGGYAPALAAPPAGGGGAADKYGGVKSVGASVDKFGGDQAGANKAHMLVTPDTGDAYGYHHAGATAAHHGYDYAH